MNRSLFLNSCFAPERTQHSYAENLPQATDLQPVRNKPQQQKAAPEPQKTRRPAYRVLIIEDDAHIARLLEVNLQRAGLEARIARDGCKGLEMFEAHTPHLVLLDLVLPGLDGFSVCQRLRASSQVPIVMMTARMEPVHQMRGFRIGADDYVIKPFDPQLLVARVIAHLRRVYRYDNGHIELKQNPNGASSKPQLSQPARRNEVLSHMPQGWAGCDACNYMGPLSQFPRKFNGHDATALACPNCGSQGHISFTVGQS